MWWYPHTPNNYWVHYFLRIVASPSESYYVRWAPEVSHFSFDFLQAAVAIQRRVRHWLHTRAEKQDCKPYHPVSRISEERLQQLQQEVSRWDTSCEQYRHDSHMVQYCNQCYFSRWQDTHYNTKFPGMKQMVDLHFKVQNRLTSFYWRVSEGSSRQQREKARCAQLDALCMLMSGE
jgi:hypothetical protein